MHYKISNKFYTLGKSYNIALVFLMLFMAVPDLALGFKRPKLYTYTVEGISTVNENNFENARVSAMADAMKNAVRLSIGAIAGSELFIESSEDIQMFVEEYYEKYIHGYRVLNETIDEEYFSVTLSVTLFPENIKRDLSKAGFGSLEEPLMVLVLIDDKASPIYSRENFLTLFSVSEDEIIKRLSADGWNVTGRTSISAISDLNDIVMSFSGDLEKTVYIGKELNADIVVLGTTTIAHRYDKRISEKIETEIELSLRVVSVIEESMLGVKKEIGVSDVEDSVLAAAQSMREAGRKAAIYLSDILKEHTELRKDKYPFYYEPE